MRQAPWPLLARTLVESTITGLRPCPVTKTIRVFIHFVTGQGRSSVVTGFVKASARSGHRLDVFLPPCRFQRVHALIRKGMGRQ